MKVKAISSILVLFFLSTGLSAQSTFSIVIRDSITHYWDPDKMIQTFDEGYLVSLDSIFIKLDSLGNVLWARTMKLDVALNDWDYHSTFAESKDSNLLFLGIKNGRIFFEKMNQYGDTLWSTNLDVIATNSIPQSPFIELYDSSFALIWSVQNGIFYCIIDKNGNLSSSEILESPSGSIYASNIQQTPDSSIVISGMYSDFSGNYSLIIVIDPFGAITISKKFRSIDYWFDPVPQIIHGTKVVTDGIICVFGSRSHINFTKFDFQGNINWIKTYSRSIFSNTPLFCPSIDKGFLISGFDLDGSELSKFDSTGNLIWSRGYEAGIKILKEAKDKGIVFLANGYNYGGGYDGGIIKVDSLGISSQCDPGTSNPPVQTIDSIQSSSVVIISSAFGNIGQELQLLGGQFYNLFSDTACLFFNYPLNNSFFKSSLFIHPNPSNGIFAISSGQAIYQAKIEIFTLSGQKIYEVIWAEGMQKEIHLQNPASGIYLVKLTDNKSQIIRKMVVY